MRRSCLLLALVASATADSDVRSGRLAEKDVNLNSRGFAEASHSLDARLAVPVDASRVGKVMLRSRQVKRDDKYEEWKEDYEDRLEEMQDQNGPPGPGYVANGPEDNERDDDDDDDDDDHDGPSGGVIAGAVIGGLLGLLLLLTLWYCLRIRPKRKQRQMEAAREQEKLEQGFGGSSPSIHPPPPTMAGAAVSPSESPSSHHIQWAPTPFPGRAPSVQTGSSISGLALPTPALTYSPSVTTATTGTAAGTPNLPPSHYNAPPSDKPPAYAAVLALQSSEPQPEASAYQMGHVPIPAEPPVYQLPSLPQTGATDMKGEPISRY